MIQVMNQIMDSSNEHQIMNQIMGSSNDPSNEPNNGF